MKQRPKVTDLNDFQARKLSEEIEKAHNKKVDPGGVSQRLKEVPLLAQNSSDISQDDFPFDYEANDRDFIFNTKDSYKDLNSEQRKFLVKSQDLDYDLEAWLKAYCDIPNNVCEIPSWEPVAYHNNAHMYAMRRRRSQKNKAYREARRNTDLSSSSYVRMREIMKQEYNWHSGRPPSVNDLIVQAYKQGESFSQHAEMAHKLSTYDSLRLKDRVNILAEISSSDKAMVSTQETKPVPESNDSYVPNFILIGEPSPAPNRLRMKKKRKARLKAKYRAAASAKAQREEEVKYKKWLEKMEIVNRWFDYVPSHQVGPNGQVLYTRYGGKDAGRFAPAERSSVRYLPIVRNELWQQYLLQYRAFLIDMDDPIEREDYTKITQEELRERAALIWGLQSDRQLKISSQRRGLVAKPKPEKSERSAGDVKQTREFVPNNSKFKYPDPKETLGKNSPGLDELARRLIKEGKWERSPDCAILVVNQNLNGDMSHTARI